MKKVINAILIAVVMTAICIPAYATSYESVSSDFESERERVRTLAYMDLEQADGGMKEQIIEAREEIIFSHGWVADGYEGYIIDENGNVLEEVPTFAELFPSDWDIPNMEFQGTDGDYGLLMPMQEEGNVYYNDYLDLSEPDPDRDSPPFCYVQTEEMGWHLTSLSTFGSISVPNATYNVGYANGDTGKTILWEPFIDSGDGCLLLEREIPLSSEVTVRASSNDTPGEWWFTVFGDLVYE